MGWGFWIISFCLLIFAAWGMGDLLDILGVQSQGFGGWIVRFGFSMVAFFFVRFWLKRLIAAAKHDAVEEYKQELIEKGLDPSKWEYEEEADIPLEPKEEWKEIQSPLK